MPFLNPIAILALLVAISVHEWAHAYVVTRLGDPTPEDAGRLTLNPIAHIDPLGALMFLIVGFGWAKPVPVNPRYFRHHKRDVCLTAAAGPISNLILACVAFALLMVMGVRLNSAWELLLPASAGAGADVSRTFVLQFLGTSLFVNLGLMALNLIPIAPLDGSKVLEAFIPYRHADQYQDFMRRGPFILLGLLLAERILRLPLLSTWIVSIMDWTLAGMNAVARVFL